jgi:general secretion pathway protein F
MARYAYVAIDRDGREHAGALYAADESDARAQLEKRKLMPVRVAAAQGEGKSSAPAQPAAPASGAKLSHRTQMLFARQLATLIEAAVPVDEALALIAEQQEQAQARRIITDVHEGVLEGQRLAEAMGRHPLAFPALLRAAIAGGERAGKLGPVLTRLADYLARAHALRTKITTAMIYPAALSAIAVLVISCLMIFVVPSLTEQFKTFNAKLPLVTQILIGVSGFLSTFWPLVLAGVVIVGVASRTFLKQAHVAFAVDQGLLRAPLLGRWSRVVNASRFARAMATLVSSGLPVLDSVRSARETVSNRYAARMINRMSVWIEEGEPLSNAMRRAGIFPPLVTYMAASGENAGELPSMLEKAADHLDQEFEAFTATALSLFEPAVIVVMGGIVASIVLAIMLPILQLNTLAIG